MLALAQGSKGRQAGRRVASGLVIRVGEGSQPTDKAGESGLGGDEAIGRGCLTRLKARQGQSGGLREARDGSGAAAKSFFD
jgi:hypothetical protein